MTGEKWSHTIVKGFAWNTTSVAGLLLEMTNALVHVTENASPIKVDISFGFKLSMALAYELKIAKDGSDQLATKKGKICLKSTIAEGEKTALRDRDTEITNELTKLSKKVTNLRKQATSLTEETVDIHKHFLSLSDDVTWIIKNASFL